MASNLDVFQTFNKEQLEAATTSSSSLVKSLETIAVETTDYSKKSLESGSAFLAKLQEAKSFESAIQIQSEYAKAAYAHFVEYLTKIGELYSNLAKEAFKPIEALVAKVQSGKHKEIEAVVATAQSGENLDGIEGNWKQFAGKIKEKWGKLTDNDLAQINGKREKLEGKLQELYGHGNEQAKKEIDDFLGRLK